MEDSGRYTMIVQNKYGGESVDIVVSVIAVQHKLQDFLRGVMFLTICGSNLVFSLGTVGYFCDNAGLIIVSFV